jgi:solute carrier family 25 (mitochondrial oxoglutarate transporter), member 11
MSEGPKQSGVWTALKPFVNGGISGMMATTIIQPIDMVKVRIQLGAQGSPLKVASDIVAKDGTMRQAICFPFCCACLI